MGARENIAAILTTFCRFHNLSISRKTIFEQYCGDSHMAHFQEIIRFCTEWEIEHMHLNFVLEHLEQQFLPAFVLMEGYRTQLVMYAEGDKVFFVDAQTGWHEQTKEDFFARSMGHIIMTDPKSHKPEPAFAQHEAADKKASSMFTWEKPTLTKLEQELNYGKQVLQKPAK